MNKNDFHSSGAMRAEDVARFLGISRSTVWRWQRAGRLPKGRRLSARCTVWLRQDISDFLNQSGKGTGGKA